MHTQLGIENGLVALVSCGSLTTLCPRLRRKSNPSAKRVRGAHACPHKPPACHAPRPRCVPGLPLSAPCLASFPRVSALCQVPAPNAVARCVACRPCSAARSACPARRWHCSRTVFHLGRSRAGPGRVDSANTHLSVSEISCSIRSRINGASSSFCCARKGQEPREVGQCAHRTVPQHGCSKRCLYSGRLHRVRACICVHPTAPHVACAPDTLSERKYSHDGPLWASRCKTVPTSNVENAMSEVYNTGEL